MGLLPKYPGMDANTHHNMGLMKCYHTLTCCLCSLLSLSEAQEVKRISQMWKEMEHSHQKAYLMTLG